MKKLLYAMFFNLACMNMLGSHDTRSEVTNSLIDAIIYNKETVQTFIENGADVNAFTSNEYPPFRQTLLQCALVHNIDAVEALITAGAKVNVTDSYGRNSLHYAYQRRAPLKIIQLLLDEGASQNMHDQDGKLPIYYAY